MTLKKWNSIYDKTYETILKYFKDNPDDFGEINEVEFEAVEDFAYELEHQGIISFGLHSRNDKEGTDYWTQAEYYSKIGKTVVFDYDYEEFFANLDDFAITLAKTEADIQQFESRLSIK